jgi:hypothetical protein
LSLTKADAKPTRAMISFEGPSIRFVNATSELSGTSISFGDAAGSSTNGAVESESTSISF